MQRNGASEEANEDSSKRELPSVQAQKRKG